MVMGKLNEEQELRVWLLKQKNNAMPLFEKWHWLKKGLKKNDLRLRKLCLKGDFGLFGSPQEMLEWIKNGAITRCCRKAGGSGDESARASQTIKHDKEILKGGNEYGKGMQYVRHTRAMQQL